MKNILTKDHTLRHKVFAVRDLTSVSCSPKSFTEDFNHRSWFI